MAKPRIREYTGQMPHWDELNGFEQIIVESWPDRTAHLASRPFTIPEFLEARGDEVLAASWYPFQGRATRPEWWWRLRDLEPPPEGRQRAILEEMGETTDE